MSKNCDYIAVSNNLSAEHTFRTFNDPLCLSQNKLFLLSTCFYNVSLVASNTETSLYICGLRLFTQNVRIWAVLD